MNTILKVEDVVKEYRLGAIGGATLKGELQSWWARKRHKEDPNVKIGAKQPTISNEKFRALDGVSFEVERGEALGIIGHNGAGKSTLLKLISRVTAPTEGKIYLNGTIASMLEVGTGFHPELTGRENVYLNGAILGMTAAEIDKKFDRIVEFSELSKFIDTPVKRYSSGMYVKLAFSVAAHLNSDIMIMDEVLAVGDVDFQKKCLGRMSEASVHENRTVLYVSHNISTVRALCTKCLVLDHGKVSYLGDVETGISMYLGLLNEESKNEFDLSNKPRRIDTALTSGVKMQRAVLAGKDKNIYKTGEPIELKVYISSEKACEDVHIGITNMYVDGSRIGGTVSNIFDLKKGENEILLSIPTDAIPDGVYSFELIINQKDKNDMNVRLDSVKQGIPFSIVNDGVSFIKNWDHNTFGHTAYTNAVVKTL
jgi:lipopolysaccharide transport system ATP-binding protein